MLCIALEPMTGSQTNELEKRGDVRRKRVGRCTAAFGEQLFPLHPAQNRRNGSLWLWNQTTPTLARSVCGQQQKRERDIRV